MKNTPIYQNDFARMLAPVLGIDPKHTEFYMRKLKEAGILPKGKPQTNGAIPLTLETAVKAVIGVIASDAALNAPEQYNDIAPLDCTTSVVSIFQTTVKQEQGKTIIVDTVDSFRTEPTPEGLSTLFGMTMTGVFIEDLQALLRRWLSRMENDRCPSVSVSWGPRPYAIIEIPDVTLSDNQGGGPTVILKYGINAPQVGNEPTSRFSSLKTLPGNALSGLLYPFSDETAEITEETQPTKGKRRYG